MTNLICSGRWCAQPLRLFLFTIASLVFGSPATAGEPFVLVSNHFNGDSVSQYSLDGAWQGYFVAPGSGGLSRAVGIQMGPDGHLYVSSEGTGQILRYDGQTGAFDGVFADDDRLTGVGYITFGPQGDLYASVSGDNEVLRIDHASGSVVSAVATGGGLNGPDGFVFSEDGEILVSSYFTNSIKRYDVDTGGHLGDLVAAGGLIRPLHLSVVNGELQAVSQGTNSIRRYAFDTGAYLGDVISAGTLNNPIQQLTLPDGDLLVSSYSNSTLNRYGADGTFESTFANGAAQGVHSPTNMIFVPAPGGVVICATALMVLTSGRRRPQARS